MYFRQRKKWYVARMRVNSVITAMGNMEIMIQFLYYGTVGRSIELHCGNHAKKVLSIKINTARHKIMTSSGVIKLSDQLLGLHTLEGF